jgi:catechol 2,3-dioxygenase-like lactoylglutathione lyase family enzyme
MNRPAVNRPFHDPSGLLHHVEIYVSDLRTSTEFWDWLLTELGYARFQEWEQGISWKRRDTYLVFVQTAPEHLDVPYHRGRTGLNHLAFHARSRRQVDDITSELPRRGATILYNDEHPRNDPGVPYAVYFEDPDRIKVELVAPD